MNFLIFCLSLFLFFKPVFAEQVSGDVKEINFSDFSGGMNTSIVPYKLDYKFSPFMQNVDIDNLSGRLKAINGFTVLGATTSLSEINLIQPFFVEGQPKEYIISDSSVVLTTRDFMTFTQIKSGLNKNYLLSSIVVDDKVWFSNGIDPIFTYDLSTTTVLDGRTYSGKQTPNVPRGACLAYYHDRVWIYNSTYSASALHYSVLSSTDGFAIAPDDYRAWPLTATLFVDKGNGANGTAIWIYQGKLFASKFNGMYVVNGNSPDTYFIQKVNNEVGPISKDSLTVLNNVLYFKGTNNIYASDGITAQRISDPIYNEVSQISRTNQNIMTNYWPNEFLFSAGSTVGFNTFTSSLTMQIQEPISRNGNSCPSDCTYDFTSSTSTGWENVYPADILDYTTTQPSRDYDANFSYYIINYSNFTGGEILKVCSSNKNTNANQCSNFPITTTPSGSILVENSTMPFRLKELLNSSVTVRVELENAVGVSNRTIRKFWRGASEFQIQHTTGSYVSNIVTITAINSWDNFNADYETNGGFLNFYFRSSNDVNTVSTQTFVGVVPGAGISADTSHMYYQWGSSVIAGNLNNPYSLSMLAPILTNVEVSRNEGGTSNLRPILTTWNNRLWISASTNAASTQKYMLIKSRLTNQPPHAWMPIVGINCASFAPLDQDDIFLCGSSTAGAILRLDYGTNFNGQPIVPIYDTPDITFGNNFFKKDILKYLIDTEKQLGGTLRIGVKVDDNDFVYSDVDISGNGRYLSSLNNVNKSGYRFRFRFTSPDLDKDLRLNSFSILFKQTMRGN